MVFASPIFLFLFLPLVLAGYFGLPRRWGNAVLLVASLCFYAWGEGPYAAIVLASIAFNWLVGRPLGDAQSVSTKRRWLTLGVAGNLALLAKARAFAKTISRRCGKFWRKTSPHCARRDPAGETPGFEFYVYACPNLRVTGPGCIATRWPFR
jgi:D-alanyl-lipoteichoic acid acyltransferase DltB (MBOAT superfamily)